MLHHLLASLRSGLRKSKVRSTAATGVRLRVEPLVMRLVPACNVSVSAGVVTINCGAASDVVNISDDGAGGISGAANGVPFNFAGVSGVNVATGDGSDTVSYTLTGALTTPRTVAIGLGRGSDSANLDLADHDCDPATHLGINSKLKISVDGGRGNDVVTAAVDIVLAETDPVLGPDTPDLDLKLNGSNDQDTLRADVMLAGGSTGDYTGLVNGSKGSDTLTHTVRGNTTGVVAAVVDGSGNIGFDTCTRTANVAKDSCESDIVIL